MNKSNINFLVVLLLIAVVAAVAAEHDNHHDHEKSDEKQHGHGPCGEFSTERMLTHTLRHCEKAARDLHAPVSAQCCRALEKVSKPCLRAIFVSGAFRQVGINPDIAMTIPERCHY